MQFREYLKRCREHNNLTQEGLVHALYSFDIAHFKGLDTTTVSKWERGITTPPISRQAAIIRYFQSLTGLALPCLDHYNAAEIEKLICEPAIFNLLGKSRELILNYPHTMIQSDDIQVMQVRNSENFDDFISMNTDLDKGFNNRYSGLNDEDFKKWALHPSNTFFVCEYKKQFFGLLFSLRLKPESFQRIISLEIMEKELTHEDFASYDEMGSIYTISFFALNEKAASMLFMRHFAYLIAHQKVIDRVGLAYIMDDAARLIKNMQLEHQTSKQIGNGLILQSFAQTLPRLLTSEYTLKTIFETKNCPDT